MFNAEVMCAYADNNRWFAAANEEITSKPEKYFGSKAKFAKYFESFNNLLFTWGNAGAGKTVFLAKMAAKQYQRNNKDEKVIVSGPNKERAENLTKATSVEENYDRIELFKYILGEDSEAFKKYEAMMSYVNENRDKTSMEINGKQENPYEYYNEHPITIKYNGQDIVLAKSGRVLSDDFIKADEVINKPSLAIVDEITKFDTFELQILDRAGIKIIGLGDRS
jgi:GTPase SAR1 family protein